MAAPLRRVCCLSSSFMKCHVILGRNNSIKVKLTNKIPVHRCIHSQVTRQIQNCQWSHHIRLFNKTSANTSWSAVLATRHASSTSGTPPGAALPEGYIPDIPKVPGEPNLVPTIPKPEDLLPELTALGEPTFKSLGLSSNYPTGWFQSFLETIHVSLDVPWWTAIMIVVFCFRTIMIPVFAFQMKSTMHFANHAPQVAWYQGKIKDAQSKGNVMDVQAYTQRSLDYSNKHDIKPWKSAVGMAVQVPLMLTAFMSMRHINEANVASFQTGGIWWFKDLTLTDPYYILPLICCTSLLINIELGNEANKASDMSYTRKWVMRSMPVFVFFFTLRFPAAMTLYWTFSNIFTIFQGIFLRSPRVKNFVGIPDQMIAPTSTVTEHKGFREGFRDTWNTSKMMNELHNRKEVENAQFSQAGTGPIPKTYSYDPTKRKYKKTKEERWIEKKNRKSSSQY